jgi:hypothetical protein
MKDEEHHRAEDSRDSAPEPAVAGRPLKDVPDAKKAKWTLKPLKNCGDCKPGGFGSTYGFSPR